MCTNSPHWCNARIREWQNGIMTTIGCQWHHRSNGYCVEDRIINQFSVFALHCIYRNWLANLDNRNKVIGYDVTCVAPQIVRNIIRTPDNKVHEAYMGPTWGRQDPGGPKVGPMNLALRDCCWGVLTTLIPYHVMLIGTKTYMSHRCLCVESTSNTRLIWALVLIHSGSVVAIATEHHTRAMEIIQFGIKQIMHIFWPSKNGYEYSIPSLLLDSLLICFDNNATAIDLLKV